MVQSKGYLKPNRSDFHHLVEVKFAAFLMLSFKLIS